MEPEPRSVPPQPVVRGVSDQARRAAESRGPWLWVGLTLLAPILFWLGLVVIFATLMTLVALFMGGNLLEWWVAWAGQGLSAPFQWWGAAWTTLTTVLVGIGLPAVLYGWRR